MAQGISGLIKKIKRAVPFGGNRAESVLGIDIGSSAIKIVQLRREKGVAVLETYGELALGPYGSVAIGHAVDGRLHAEKYYRTVSEEFQATRTVAFP